MGAVARVGERVMQRVRPSVEELSQAATVPEIEAHARNHHLYFSTILSIRSNFSSMSSTILS